MLLMPAGYANRACAGQAALPARSRPTGVARSGSGPAETGGSMAR